MLLAKGAIHAGDHAAIVDQGLWDRVQAQQASNAATRRSGRASKEPSLLAGLLFDSWGNRMTPSHAVKSGKRYRYYLSNHLIAGARRGREADAGEGIRIPAQEIEGHVVSAIATFLADPQQVIAELCPDNTAPATASAVLRRAEALGDHLRAGPGEHYETVRDLIARVEIGDDAIGIALKRNSLATQLDIPFDATTPDADMPLELMLPAELRRLGKEKRLIVAALLPETSPDPVLIKAIVRAHHWFGMLRSRSVESIADIARAEGLSRTYVSSVVPFAFLAPDITAAILDGTQPVDLSLDRLMNAQLPPDWAGQRSVLGFK